MPSSTQQSAIRLRPTGGFSLASSLLGNSAAPSATAYYSNPGAHLQGGGGTATTARTDVPRVRAFQSHIVALCFCDSWRDSPTTVEGAQEARITFVRDATNEHDACAIAALLDGAKLGFLPRLLAYTLSQYMDTGEVELLPVTLTKSEATELRASELSRGDYSVELKLRSTGSSTTITALHNRLDEIAFDKPEPDELLPRPRPLPPPPQNCRRSAANNTRGLAVLSLFSGISADIVALDRAGVKLRFYASSEVDEGALAVVRSAMNRRAQKQQEAPCRSLELGDVRCLDDAYLAHLADTIQLDLLIGGSPCQDLSRMAGPSRKGLAGSKSSLFFEYARVLAAVRRSRPQVVFVLENVYGMPAADRDAITSCLGVTPVRLRACDVSAVRRDRYFWSNLPPRGLRPSPAVRVRVDIIGHARIR